MTIKTPYLDQAAFYLTWGGKLTLIEGEYPRNIFILYVPKIVLWYEKKIGYAPYKKLCEYRRTIKEKARTQAGLPKHFTGRNGTGFSFMDIAHT